MSEDFFFMYKY